VFVLVSVGAILRSRFPPTTRERREKISAGAEEKECPPKRATPLNRVFEKSSATAKRQLMFHARGEEDTEWENKTGRTLARPPIGGPSECRGGSANNALGGWANNRI